MSQNYRKWWEAFRVLGKVCQRGWQKQMAEKIGCSTKHLSMIYSGNARASMELQEKISNYFGVPYHKMVEHGAQILKALEKDHYFPGYHKVIALPKEKRFDAIVEVAQQQTACPFVVFDPALREKYARGEISEQEVYEAVKRHMETVRDAVEKKIETQQDIKQEAGG